MVLAGIWILNIIVIGWTTWFHIVWSVIFFHLLINKWDSDIFLKFPDIYLFFSFFEFFSLFYYFFLIHLHIIKMFKVILRRTKRILYYARVIWSMFIWYLILSSSIQKPWLSSFLHSIHLICQIEHKFKIFVLIFRLFAQGEPVLLNM